jgi:hypothetical protein
VFVLETLDALFRLAQIELRLDRREQDVNEGFIHGETSE